MSILSTFFLDPVVIRAAAAALSVVFLVGGWQKLRDGDVFASAVENYRLLPAPLIPVVARLLPLVELACGVLLLFPETATLGGTLAVLLLLTVTFAVAINLLRGRDSIDCGCGGLSSQPLSWVLVGRNVILMAMVGLAVQHGGDRPLIWADYFTAGGAVLALLGLYVAANQLMSNAPLALAMRNK